MHQKIFMSKKGFYINLYRKRKYKPFYKQFINLKKNIQFKKEKLFLKFNRIKWKKFKTNNFKYPKMNYAAIDHSRFSVSTSLKNVLKKNFNQKLNVKKKLFLFYGKLSEKCFLKYSKFIKKRGSNLLLLKMLEMRIDLVLYRSHFVSSIRIARQLILHKHIFVNKKKITTSSFLLKNGDLVDVSLKLHHLILNSICNKSNLWPIPPKYLQIDYKTLQILFNHNIKFTNFFTYFSFWLNVNTILSYYRM